MPRKTSTKAKGIQRPSGISDALSCQSDRLVDRLDRLSRLLDAESAAGVDRCLATVNADTIGATIGQGRSTVYDWRQHPDRIPVSKLIYLAVHDRDPEFLLRMGNLLYQAAAEVAADRKRRKVSTVVIESPRLDFEEAS